MNNGGEVAPMASDFRVISSSDLNNSLLDLLPLFGYVRDLDGTFRHVSPHAFQTLGYTPQAIAEQATTFFSRHVHSDDAIRLRDAEERIETAKDGEVVETECRLRHARGDWRWILRREVVAERDDDGAVTQVLGLVEDITERKLSERHLMRHHERLLHLLAYDIHDGFVQDVVGAQMMVEGLIEDLRDSHSDRLQELILLRGLLRKAIDEGRRMITELRPMIIDEMGVIEALKYLVGEEQTAERLDVTFTHDVNFDRLDPMLEGTIFRIVQESLNNVRRHAKVNEATVRLTQDGAMLLIEVEDHGCGFSPAATGTEHFGLDGIRERARLLGGRADIRSEPGTGTVVSVTLPTQLPPEWRNATGS